MSFSTEEIRTNLTAFAGRWDLKAGYEKGEAQTFLNEFLSCFDPELPDRAQFEHFQKDSGFEDCRIPDLVIIEMKSATEADKLEKHRKQLLDYWKNSADPEAGTPAPRYAVLCAFRRFELWEPGSFPGEPRLVLDLDELPQHFAAFSFLLGEEPIFDANDETITVEAVNELAQLLNSLEERDEGSADERRSFLLQSVWCMFAEDTGQLEDLGFTRLLQGLLDNPGRSSADDLGGLFEWLNNPNPERPKHGLYQAVPYVNGSLFEHASHIHLETEELEMMRRLASFDWSLVEPAVFGSLMQAVFGPERQHRLGAHYTPEFEIQLVVGPTITEPWKKRIDSLASYEDAVSALRDLHEYRVLDPACGCGNFLSIAFRELRGIEDILRRKITELAKSEGRGVGPEVPVTFFPISNMHGIEIEAFAVDLARLSLWMAQWLAAEELGQSEKTLPLTDLFCIKRGDALHLSWPEAEAIVSNPPYHGSQNLRSVLPDEQVDYIEQEFGCGLKDLCVYWFRRAAQVMRPGDRAGMVGTNSIAQNKARAASLNYVVEHGGVITHAISRHDWPGEAVVNVSIVNWVAEPPESPSRFTLDGAEVVGINTRLQQSKVPVEEYEPLPANAGRSFQGPIPAGDFYLDFETAKQLLEKEPKARDSVIRPFLVGRDIAEDPAQRPSRMIIDFGHRSLEEAMEFPECLAHVSEHVKPEREKTRRKANRENWWKFAEPRRAMRSALAPLRRFIGGNRVGKRFLFSWVSTDVCPGDATNVFAFQDDYSMGILCSSTHLAWAHSEGSSLRKDPRYTPTSCFETFPWPSPTEAQREEIGRLTRELIELRSSICEEKQIGLTTLYNQMDEGAWRDLRKAHEALDKAVAKAYGWSAKVAGDPVETRARLAELHARAIADPDSYRPFDYLAA
jgi:hypothetical protein